MPAPIYGFTDETFNSVFVITPSDSVNIGPPGASAFLVTVAGNVSLVPLDGGAAVTVPVSANTVYPIGIRRVNSTGTTATGIVGFRR